MGSNGSLTKAAWTRTGELPHPCYFPGRLLPPPSRSSTLLHSTLLLSTPLHSTRTQFNPIHHLNSYLLRSPSHPSTALILLARGSSVPSCLTVLPLWGFEILMQKRGGC